MEINKNGRREYKENNVFHRLDGPALEIFRADNFNYYGKIYFQNGLVHRINAPAVTFYDDNHITEYWIENGKLHRIEGPAIVYNVDGKITEIYFLNDKRLSKEDFNNAIELINLVV